MNTNPDGKKTAFITGGTGFIGEALIRALHLSGWNIISYDLADPSDMERYGIHVRSQVGNILDRKSLIEAMHDVDCVFHLAGISTIPECSANPHRAIETNVLGTCTVLEAMREAAPHAIFFLASSAHVYGGGNGNTRFDENSLTAPGSIYGASKVAAETIARRYAEDFGLDLRIGRYSNVYGPRQARNIFYDFCMKAQHADAEFFIEGSGMQQRDFIYVDDAVAASIDVATGVAEDCRLVNISSGTATAVSVLAKNVCASMGRSDLALRTTQRSWVGDGDVLTCDNTKLTTLFPRTFTDIAAGIASYVEWFKTVSKH